MNGRDKITFSFFIACPRWWRRRGHAGRGGRQVVELCTAALNLGCIVAYLNILADVLSAVAGTIIPPGAEPSRNAYIMGERASPAAVDWETRRRLACGCLEASLRHRGRRIAAVNARSALLRGME